MQCVPREVISTLSSTSAATSPHWNSEWQMQLHRHALLPQMLLLRPYEQLYQSQNLSWMHERVNKDLMAAGFDLIKIKIQ